MISNHETKDCLHFNKLYGNRKELLLKEKDAKSKPIPLLNGSMCCLGSQSSVVQNNVTADEDAMYALYAAIVEDRTWNINKPKSITKQEEPFYSSTVCIYHRTMDRSSHLSH